MNYPDSNCFQGLLCWLLGAANGVYNQSEIQKSTGEGNGYSSAVPPFYQLYAMSANVARYHQLRVLYYSVGTAPASITIPLRDWGLQRRRGA